MQEEKPQEQTEPDDSQRKIWEPPEIVLERPLFVNAQGGGPQGLLGPFSVSGGPCGEPH